MKKTVTEDFDEIIAEDLRDDGFVTAYLNDALADPDPRVFLVALRRVAKARGTRIAQLASTLKLTRRGLYYALSEKGNPQWATLQGLLGALGFRLRLTPKKAG